MTANQIARLNYLENARSNQAREFETNRSNVANETERHRANLANEGETKRSNQAKEMETARHNKMSENIDIVDTVGKTIFGKGGVAGAIKLLR